MGSLLLIRHGSTKENQPPESFRGWQDLPMDAEGRQDVQTLAQHLRGLPIGLIWTSDLSRAQETARIIAQVNVHHPGVHPTPLLRPWNVGKFAGQSVTQAKPALRQYLDKPNTPVPGGESVATFANRFLPFFFQILGTARNVSDMVGAVTHTRNIRLALERLRHPDDMDVGKLLAKADPVEPADFVVLEWTGGRWHTISSAGLVRPIPTGAA